jgi:ABC-type polysaccharide/polyol phosphate transport system ATPase subunit
VDAIVVNGVSKRFRVMTIPKQVSLKEAIVRLQLFRPAKGNERFIDAVRDVSFRIPKGTSLGIVGRNGSGKTTLLRLLAGIYRPNSGTIKVAGEVAPLLSLGVGFHPEMTGRENVKLNGLVLGMSPQQIEARFDEIVDFAELREFIDIPVRTYSSGMYMRLAFAIAVSTDPDVLLLDEVLAVGDEAFAEKCFRRIREFRQRGKTIVLVTHDPTTVANWCESALWMDRGAARMFGPAQEVMTAYHADSARRSEPIFAG